MFLIKIKKRVKFFFQASQQRNVCSCCCSNHKRDAFSKIWTLSSLKLFEDLSEI